jgi:hypothetical protein
MQPLESLAPSPAPVAEPKSARSDQDSNRPDDDPFDLIMGRTIAHAQSDTDSEAPNPHSVRLKSRPDKPANSNANPAAAADAMAAAYGSPPPPPQAVGIGSRLNSRADAEDAADPLNASAGSKSIRSPNVADNLKSPPGQPADEGRSGTGTPEAHPARGSEAGKTAQPLNADASEDRNPDANANDASKASQLVKLVSAALPDKLSPPASASGSVDPPAKIDVGGVARENTADPTGLGGISSAQQHLAMQKADKTKESAPSAQQNLPTSPANGAGEDLPARLVARTGSLVARSTQSDTPAAAPVSLSSSAPASPSSVTGPAPSAAEMSGDALRSLERTQDLMSLHAFRLRDAGADSLQVMIRPGAGVQISLQLQMRDGMVEMRATLHRGDFDFLSRNWQQLQQQLEPRGVRLAPLLSGNPTSTGSQHFFQSPRGRPEDPNTELAGLPAELALASALKPTTAKVKTSRNWETWA